MNDRMILASAWLPNAAGIEIQHRIWRTGDGEYLLETATRRPSEPEAAGVSRIEFFDELRPACLAWRSRAFDSQPTRVGELMSAVLRRARARFEREEVSD